MTNFQRIFTAPAAIEIQAEIGRQILRCEAINAKARRHGQPPPLELMIRGLARTAANNRRALNAVAARTAANATSLIRERLAVTAKRSPTGVAPHLKTLIASRPLSGPLANTGSVGIARTSTLDRAINPNTPGYGPYWRAQEYGTGSEEVTSQLGRTIVGFFYGRGASGPGSRPAAIHAGGGGPHPLFIPGSQRQGARGGVGGRGTIRKEIEGRHFIRDGADAAREKWRSDMRGVDRTGARAIAALPTNPSGRGGRRSTRRR